MGLFAPYKNDQSSTVNWEKLENEAQLNEAIHLSKEQPVLLFKHSTRCGISVNALKRFESEWSVMENSVGVYYLDLLRYRAISNLIAEKFGVIHESPQILVLKEGECVYSASHGQIDGRKIKAIL